MSEFRYAEFMDRPLEFAIRFRLLRARNRFASERHLIQCAGCLIDELPACGRCLEIRRAFQRIAAELSLALAFLRDAAWENVHGCVVRAVLHADESDEEEAEADLVGILRIVQKGISGPRRRTNDLP